MSLYELGGVGILCERKKKKDKINGMLKNVRSSRMMV